MVSKQNLAPLTVPRRLRLSITKVVALLLCAIAVAVIFNAVSFPATAIDTDIGAGAFPAFYAGILIVLAILLVLRDALPHVTSSKSTSGDNETDQPAYRNTAAGIFLTGVYILLMGYVGYLITTPLFLLCLMVLMGYRRWLMTPVIAILLTTILWLLFVDALQVPLPVGSFFE